MAGRRRKNPKDVVDKICKAVKLGSTYRIACQYAGISETLFYEWMAEGRSGKNPEKAEFAEQVKTAESEAAMLWLDQIDTAARNGSWQAAAWRLERRYPQDYGRRAAKVIPVLDKHQAEHIDPAVREAITLIAKAIKDKDGSVVSSVLLQEISEDEQAPTAYPE